MNTYTCGDTYEHDNVYVNQLDDYLDYGWYKHFSTEIHSSLLKIKKCTIPSTWSVTGNAQRTFLDNVTLSSGLSVQ